MIVPDITMHVGHSKGFKAFMSQTGHKPKKTNSMAEGGPEPECGATHAENGTNKEAK